MKKRDLKKLALLGLTSGLLAATQGGLQANDFATEAALLPDMSPETQTLAKLVTRDGSNRQDIAYRGASCSGSGGCSSSSPSSSYMNSSDSHGCSGANPYNNSQGYQNMGGNQGGHVIQHGCSGQGGAPNGSYQGGNGYQDGQVIQHGCSGQGGSPNGGSHGCSGYQGGNNGYQGGQVIQQGCSGYQGNGGIIASQSAPTGRPYNQPNWQQGQPGQPSQLSPSSQTSQSTTRSMPQFENQPRYQEIQQGGGISQPSTMPTSQPAQPGRPTALLDSPAKPVRYIATVAIDDKDDKAINAKLNSDSRAIYKDLSPEGKKLAVKLGNQSCKGQNDCKGLNSCKGEKNSCAGKGSCRGTSPGPFKDFNDAVKVAKMKEKRQSALRGY